MGTIIVVSGLPGTGKTTLSAELTRALGATYLRVDAVETALERAGIEPGPLGYAVVHELAQSNLLLGRDVVVDLVNPWPLTRSMWADLAAATGRGTWCSSASSPTRSSTDAGSKRASLTSKARRSPPGRT